MTRPGEAAAAPPVPVQALATLQEQLLDIGNRNRLISTPVGNPRAKQIKIVDEVADELFQILHRNGRKMSFEPAPEAQSPTDAAVVEAPEARFYVPSYAAEDAAGGSSVAARHRDSKLQTALGREQLHKRLLSLYRDARLLEEEQGVSVLFLSLGFLRWCEAGAAAGERYAPLILLPVDLSRSSAKTRFTLELRDQDLEPNLSLRGRLENDFQITLPDLPAVDDWRPSDYFRRVEAAVAEQPAWSVHPEILILGFYSFAKFVMWRDVNDMKSGKLSAANPAGQELIGRLLGDGFDPAAGVLGGEQAEDNLDRRFPDPRELGHVLDADASQTEVIAAARAGGNVVVQGPPGTGKSQTIANIIAVAARDRKTVLFVAEKRAALDVVHDRLQGCGLGSLCLELHSHKANRKAVLAELKRTLDEGQPHPVSDAEYDRVRQRRDEINSCSERLHRVDPTTGDTPFGIIGEIAKLRGAGCPLPDEHLLPDADSWGRAQFQERCERVRGLAETTTRFGPEQQHTWRGVGRQLTPMDRDRLGPRLEHAATALDELCATLEAAAAATGQQLADSPAAATAAAEVDGQLAAFAKMPQAVPELLESAALREQLTLAADLAAQTAKLCSVCEQLLQHVAAKALDHNWVEARRALAARGRSPLRWFNRGYRRAAAELRSGYCGTLPRAHVDLMARIDGLLEFQRQRRELQQQSGFASAAFGRHWRGEHSDGQLLVEATCWIKKQAAASGGVGALQRRVEQCRSPQDLGDLRQGVRRRHEEWAAAWREVAQALELSVSAAFGHTEVAEVPLATVRARLAEWIQGRETLADWSLLTAAAGACSQLGLDELRARVGDGRLRAADAVSVFRYARAEAVWRRLCAEDRLLAVLDGAERTANVAAFRRADEQLRHLAAQEVALLHHRMLPSGSAGQIGIVKGEISKQRRHWALRTLLDRAGEAVIRIKPIFLMSPLSVARFLRPGGLIFDVLVIDEASQVRPADALGAIARARQIIVVGDAKQLPPSSFFDRQMEGVDEDTQESGDAVSIQAAQAADMESILTLCDARSVPAAGLRWHYRSHHPSLIAVSNDTFYDNRLIYPPSPDAAGVERGLTFTKVDGVYDRGRRRSNLREAQEVARAVLGHARSDPDATLGVATFSVAQRDALLNELELMRAEYPELEAFCREEGTGDDREPFFVKNLENVQGDERDVIFISVGYGRDANGYLAQGFGPVSRDGGERRLNVLFTRAKRHCRVFASITHHDIRLDAARNAGPRVLKRFLQFAETGELELPAATGLEPDSPFEEAVAAALRQAGQTVDPQVGMAGFRIDLAVRDPAGPGRYLIGIECDGARYHSSRWARERDRLRQSVLEQKGWTMHRIWSTDWFQRPDAELQRLLQAVAAAQAKARPAAGPPRERAPAPPVPKRSSRIMVARAAPTPAAEPLRPAVPYREAEFRIREPGKVDLHEASLQVVADYVVQVVRCEEPVHVEEVARRLSRLWGYARTGPRIQERVRSAARYAEHCGRLVLRGSFLHGAGGAQEPVVRDRSAVKSQTLRKTAMLPPEEVGCAILQAVEQNVSLSVEECAVQVARRFGFRSTSAELRRVVAVAADRLAAQGRLQREGAELRLAAAN